MAGKCLTPADFAVKVKRSPITIRKWLGLGYAPGVTNFAADEGGLLSEKLVPLVIGALIRAKRGEVMLVDGPVPKGCSFAWQLLERYPWLTLAMIDEWSPAPQGTKRMRSRKRKGCPLLGGKAVTVQWRWALLGRTFAKGRGQNRSYFHRAKVRLYRDAEWEQIAAARANADGVWWEPQEDGTKKEYRTPQRLAEDHLPAQMMRDANGTTADARRDNALVKYLRLVRNLAYGSIAPRGLKAGESLDKLVRRVARMTKQGCFARQRITVLSAIQFARLADKLTERPDDPPDTFDLPEGPGITLTGIEARFQMERTTFKHRWKRAAELLGEKPIAHRLPLKRKGRWHPQDRDTTVYLLRQAEIIAKAKPAPAVHRDDAGAWLSSWWLAEATEIPRQLFTDVLSRRRQKPLYRKWAEALLAKDPKRREGPRIKTIPIRGPIGRRPTTGLGCHEDDAIMLVRLLGKELKPLLAAPPPEPAPQTHAFCDNRLFRPDEMPTAAERPSPKSALVRANNSAVFCDPSVPSKYQRFAELIAADPGATQMQIARQIFGENAANAASQFRRYVTKGKIRLPAQ